MNVNLIKQTAKVAENIIDRARDTFTSTMFYQVVVPFLKDWQLSVCWGNGYTFYCDFFGNEVHEEDRRIVTFEKELEDILCNYGIMNHSQGYLDCILSSQGGSKTNDLFKPVSYDSPINTRRRLKISSFGELFRGDRLFAVDFQAGDIDEHIIVESAERVGDKVLIKIYPQGKLARCHVTFKEEFLVDPSAIRFENIYVDREIASSDLDKGFEAVQVLTEFLNLSDREVGIQDIESMLA